MAESSAPETRRVAVFDVDGTLTQRDTLWSFLGAVAGRPRLYLGLASDAPRIGWAMLRDDNDARGRAKARLFARLVRGHRLDDATRAAARVARSVYDDGLRADTLSLLREHLANGDEVVLLSASPELYVAPLADLLGARAGLGTRLAVDGDGRLTGDFDGVNCRGPEKARRLVEWLGSGGPVHVTAYGDSSGDKDLFDHADVAVRV